jgi:hypothetical protein
MPKPMKKVGLPIKKIIKNVLPDGRMTQVMQLAKSERNATQTIKRRNRLPLKRLRNTIDDNS